MYGTARFGDDATANVLVVPRTAFLGSVSDNKVYTVKNGKAVATTVKSGRSFGDFIEVLEGLNAGDQVIISGQINVSDQAPISIIK
ncbi:MAG: hypothetical protein LBE37_20440 [Sphingobacterium sp.]|jgi:hypothetical protein|nr:hypothetical protein [Sphingobacterium sp.]